LDPDNQATVMLNYYRQGGGAPVPIRVPPIAPMSSYSLWLPSWPSEFTSGLYGLRVASDRRIAMRISTGWMSSGAAVVYEAPAQAIGDITLPLVFKSSYGHSSLVSVLNADLAAEQTVRLTFTRTGEDGPRLTVDLRLPAGESRTLDLDTDPQFAALPAGFFGALRVSAPRGAAVQSFVDVASSEKAVYSLNGEPDERASSTLALPLLTKRGRLVRDDTLVVIANPGTEPVTAEIRWAGQASACAGQRGSIPTGSIRPGANVLVFRWPALDTGPLADVAGLPAGCLASAEVVSSGGPIHAAVVFIGAGGTLAGAYSASPTSSGGRHLLVPTFSKRGGYWRTTTLLQAQNLGPAAANVSVRFSWGAHSFDQAVTVPVGGATLIDPSAISAIPPDTFGSAAVHSDQPLDLVVVEDSDMGARDRVVYRGIVADEPPAAGSTPAPETPVAPLIINGADVRGPLRPTPDAVAATPVVPPAPPVRIYLMGFAERTAPSPANPKP
jgi:hypothetical protein